MMSEEDIRSDERHRIANYIVSLARVVRTPELSELLLDIANRVRFGVWTKEVAR